MEALYIYSDNNVIIDPSSGCSNVVEECGNVSCPVNGGVVDNSVEKLFILS